MVLVLYVVPYIFLSLTIQILSRKILFNDLINKTCFMCKMIYIYKTKCTEFTSWGRLELFMLLGLYIFSNSEKIKFCWHLFVTFALSYLCPALKNYYEFHCCHSCRVQWCHGTWPACHYQPTKMGWYMSYVLCKFD